MANLNQSSLFIEFTQSSATIALGETLAAVDLQHEPNGRLTMAARAAFKGAIKKSIDGRSPTSANCAVGVRGVSMRRLQLPPSKPEDLQQLLAIQIEREFPLGPDQLAWGFKRTNGVTTRSQPQEILLVAVKKELIEDYATLLTESGIEPDFTVGILSVAAWVSRTTNESFALVNAGPVQTEIVLCEHGTPSTIRTLPIGSDGDLSLLAQRLMNSPLPKRVFLIGDFAQDEDRTGTLQDLLGSEIVCEALSIGAIPGKSAAIAALQKLVSENGADKLLTLRIGNVAIKKRKAARPLPVRWIGIAAALVIAIIALRYVEPLIKKPALAAEIARARVAQSALPPIEEELDFLRYLENSRPAYLNVVTVLADAIPRGTKFDALTLDRRGEFGFRATLANPQQATDLRARLLESGLFSSVVLEEQTPAENNRKLITRISARWKTDPKTPSKTIDKIVAESTASSTNAPTSRSKG